MRSQPFSNVQLTSGMTAIYKQCEGCGRRHNDHGYYDEANDKWLCDTCTVERIEIKHPNKTYVIDGDTDQIIAVVDRNKSKMTDEIRQLTEGAVWWAMNDVSGLFSASIYVVSKNIREREQVLRKEVSTDV